MIEKMKKLSLFISGNGTDVESHMDKLGQLGIVHITPFQPVANESIEQICTETEQLSKAIAILDKYKNEENQSIQNHLLDSEKEGSEKMALTNKILELEDLQIQLTKQKENENKDLEWYAHWGVVSPIDLKMLEKKGVFLSLYLLHEKDLKQIKRQNQIWKFGKIGNLTQIVFMANNAEEKLDFEEIKIPVSEFNELEKIHQNTLTALDNNTLLLESLHTEKKILHNALQENKHRLKLYHVQYSGISVEQKFGYWKGYIPEKEVENLVNCANEFSWGYLIEDPHADEINEVPTKLHSPNWVKRIRPVMNFMGLVPGYNELDVSKVFMIFFTFFSGILVGDAGYGLVFMLLTLWVHRSRKFKRSVEFQLFYTLSFSVMFWGILTGTYFGSEAIANIPALSQIKINKLASIGGDEIFVQRLMFIIGAIHLSIGHLQKAWRYMNSLKSISEIGWISIVWGLYLVINQMVLGLEANIMMPWLFGVGALLIALFSHPEQKFFKGILSALANLPLSIINGFSDIISYIRLYAVGLSTVLMASSFNEMAIGSGISTLATAFGAILILILGHTLNMILAGMAVIVHGVRLNMLEYAGHAGVEFSGNEYNPFKTKKNQ